MDPRDLFSSMRRDVNSAAASNELERRRNELILKAKGIVDEIDRITEEAERINVQYEEAKAQSQIARSNFYLREIASRSELGEQLYNQLTQVAKEIEALGA